jgi:Flp pilus assembly protein TadB
MTSQISHECRDPFKHPSCNDPGCQCTCHEQNRREEMCRLADRACFEAGQARRSGQAMAFACTALLVVAGVAWAADNTVLLMCLLLVGVLLLIAAVSEFDDADNWDVQARILQDQLDRNTTVNEAM